MRGDEAGYSVRPRYIAIDTVPHRLELAKKLGATR